MSSCGILKRIYKTEFNNYSSKESFCMDYSLIKGLSEDELKRTLRHGLIRNYILKKIEPFSLIKIRILLLIFM